MYNADFSTLSFAGLDSNLVQATLESISSNSMTPIIKEELKLKIQSKRLASGKEELPKPIFKEPKKYEMTPEETEKRKHRRELNRVAARKSRNKRKLEDASVETVQAELELRNFILKKKVEDLEKEKQNLIRQLMEQQIVSVPTQTPTQEFMKDEDLMAEHHSASIIPTDQPSTSSGIFQQNCPHRRFSEDAVRPPPPPYTYIPRRHSGEVLTYHSPYPDEDHPCFTQSTNPLPGDHPFFMTINPFDINDQCHAGYTNKPPAFTEVAPLQVQQSMLKDALQITCELFDIPNSGNIAADDLARTDGKQDLPLTSNHFADDLPDFLDEDFNFTINCDAQRVSPCSSGFKCETSRMEDQTIVPKETRSLGKEETPEDPFEMYLRPLQVHAGGEDEATVPGAYTTCVTPVSPSLY